MDQIIRLEKSYHQRLEEYNEIFSGNGPFTLSRIRKEFTNYLELQVYPSGWQAIWKVPKTTCRNYKIDFPTILLVFVENVDWKRLVGKVKVLAVLDDIHLPEMHVVPLIQLWPINNERNKTNDIFDTANALDVVRFFYLNLYMPWDDDENDDDWVMQHLENRLQLFYELKNTNFPNNLAKHVRSLFTAAKNLHEQMQDVVCEDDSAELHVALLEIQKEIELFENPLARKVFIQRANAERKTNAQRDWLIQNEGVAKDYLSFLNVRTEGASVALASNLTEAYWTCGGRGSFVLNGGRHCIDEVGVLEGGGRLIGRGEAEITSSNKTVMFDFSADVLLENLTIVSAAQCAIVVRRGKLTMKNCKIIHDDNSSRDYYQGVTVLNGAVLEMIDCTINDFNIAIVANKNSSITLNNCEILDGDYGLKLYDDCVVELENTKINNCMQYGVWVEAKSKSMQQLIAGFPVLEKVFCFKVNNVTGGNNKNGDVIINYNQAEIIE